MNNSLPSLKDSEKTEKPAFPESLKSVFFQYFEQLVDSCCVRIDTEFGLQLAKDHEHVGRDQYKSLVDSLRSVRDDIRRNYLLKLSDDFNLLTRKKTGHSTDVVNLSEILLASDDFVKEDYTTNLIIRHNQQKYHEIIGRLNLRLAPLLGKSTIAPAQNPVAPENLVKALITVIKPLKLGSKQRIALYKTFDDNVFNQMGFIYHELIKHCENWQQDIDSSLPGSVQTPLDPDNPVNEEFRQLQRQLSSWRSRQALSDYDSVACEGLNCYEHFEITNALQIARQLRNTAQEPAQALRFPLKKAVLKKLEELNFSNESKTLAKIDEDVLDLVSILFSGITDCEQLPAPIKSILLELEAPMSAVCLGQYRVFSDPNHPVKHLLDALLACGRFLNHDSENGRFILKHLTHLIKKLNEGRGFAMAGWSEAAKQWHLFSEQREQARRSAESGAIQNMIDFDSQFESQQAAAMVIESSIQNRELPESIREFLMTVWKDAMIYAYASKDSQPELWQKSVHTLNELIDSLTPPSDAAERMQRLKLMPNMIRDLRSGLNAIACDKDWQSRFFKELAVLHVLTMNQKSSHTPAAKSEGQPHVEPKNPSVQPDNFDDQVHGLSIGDWLVFHLDGDRKWAKLAYKGTQSGYLLFVDKEGETFVRITNNELARQLRQNRTALIKMDCGSMTDAILSKRLYPLNSLSSP